MSEPSNPLLLNDAAKLYFENPSDETLNQVILASEGYVKYFRRLYGGSANYEDLYQAGMEGVLKAIKEYDPGKGASFATFAGHKMMGEIRHWVRKEASYRRPGSISGLQFKVDAFLEKWYKEYGLMPAPEQVAAELGIRVEGVVEVMRAGLVSFEDIDVEAIHSTSYKSFELPIEDRILLSQLYKNLSDGQKKLWHLLFEKRMTQEKTAKELGMSQRQVSREKDKMVRQMMEDVEFQKEKEHKD